MKEKPIIFSTEMVRAILDGRKTQTRRVIKPQPNNMNNENRRLSVLADCPYKKGQTLWVRETWATAVVKGERKGFAYKASFNDDENWFEEMEYGYFNRHLWFEGHWEKYQDKWRPSIFMPRKAARTFLKVTNIRVERLQDISEEDAKKEGLRKDRHGWYNNYVLGLKKYHYHNWDNVIDPDGYSGRAGEFLATEYAKTSFATLWDSINEKRGYGWDKNPWVWVIEFKRIGAPE